MTIDQTIDTTAAVAIKARMPHPAFLLEGGFDALTALSAVAASTELPDALLHLVHLRASQINGCSWCTIEHAKEMRADGASDEKVFGVAAWREAPLFTASERAALAFTEALTRIADSADPVPDELWHEVSEHFDRRQLSALILAISAINVWNRINVAIRQPAGQR
ncbi:alkylhydroperoxidase AhpD family core domain-containing protein [Microbacterium azadirachtae]|uniref:Alkylhydroperoxidase AhpD family core domain-containing protein n=1 Tax=Microbacterium azadirachtae TaxID=582680 RepID=A0A1I6GDV7_9MICO|nr:carboxymuconolactone decarboxylase family protein [Microbacterium azadirachtae]SFR40394.1 alkylhydroperoxidase AhpD family core domain-containing protein [Microbacterium azadirachtae]